MIATLYMKLFKNIRKMDDVCEKYRQNIFVILISFFESLSSRYISDENKFVVLSVERFRITTIISKSISLFNYFEDRISICNVISWNKITCLEIYGILNNILSKVFKFGAVNRNYVHAYKKKISFFVYFLHR